MSRLLAGVLTLSVIVVAVSVYPCSHSSDGPFDYAKSWVYDRWTRGQPHSLQDTTECSCAVQLSPSVAHAYLVVLIRGPDPGCTLQDSSNRSTALSQPQPASDAAQHAVTAGTLAVGMCHLSGTVQDCCKLCLAKLHAASTAIAVASTSALFCHAGCDYASVERANKQQLNPLLSQIVKTPFFRYFKVNLWCDCSFWPDDSMCILRDCAVCECEDNEVPQLWKAEEGKCKGIWCDLCIVNNGLSPSMHVQCSSFSLQPSRN